MLLNRGNKSLDIQINKTLTKNRSTKGFIMATAMIIFLAVLFVAAIIYGAKQVAW
jgi:hypothetical protein